MLNEKIVKIIFACPAYAQDGKTVIGFQGDMPWRGLVASDMKRFQILTRHKGENTVVSGRKTYVSIPEKFRPFDKNLTVEEARQTIVLTRDQSFEVSDPRVAVAHSLEEAVETARTGTLWIIGGGEIYAQALPYADYLHTTLIHGQFEGDTFFPSYDIDNWKNVYYEHFKAGVGLGQKDKVDSSYLVFQRVR